MSTSLEHRSHLLRAEAEEDARELLRELNAKLEVLDAFDNGDGVDGVLFQDVLDLAKGRKVVVKREPR